MPRSEGVSEALSRKCRQQRSAREKNSQRLRKSFKQHALLVGCAIRVYRTDRPTWRLAVSKDRLLDKSPHMRQHARQKVRKRWDAARSARNRASRRCLARAAMEDALTWTGLIAGGRPRSESARAGLGASAASAVAPATLLYTHTPGLPTCAADPRMADRWNAPSPPRRWEGHVITDSGRKAFLSSLPRPWRKADRGDCCRLPASPLKTRNKRRKHDVTSARRRELSRSHARFSGDKRVFEIPRGAIAAPAVVVVTQ
ncbi:hypothetical protein MRX96_032543 [Rhipicephalus microplus]